MGVYSDLLTAAIRSIVEVKEEKEHRQPLQRAKTTALGRPIAGLDDFELIAFLVVEPVGARDEAPCSSILSGRAKTASSQEQDLRQRPTQPGLAPAVRRRRWIKLYWRLRTRHGKI